MPKTILQGTTVHRISALRRHSGPRPIPKGATVVQEWPGGPHRARRSTRSFRDPYVCDQCKVPVVGVYRVKPEGERRVLWVCAGCRPAILAKTPGLTVLLAAEEATTKSVGGKEYPASDFLYVGDPDKPATWSLPVPDEAHVRDAMARFDQDKIIPASKKKSMAAKLAAKATKMGIDCSGFKKEYVSSEADLSFDAQQALINGALLDQFGSGADGYQRFWAVETFSGYLVARSTDGKLYRIPYTLDGDEVKLGDAQEVTTAYVPVAEACEFDAVAEADVANAAAGKYKITVIRPGWGQGSLSGQSVPHYYPPQFVQLVAEAVNGKPFGRKHPDQRGPDPTGATQPERIAGWVDGGSLESGRATGYVNLFSAEADLRSRLDEARTAGKLNLFGISMLAAVGYKPGVVEGKQCLVAESLGNLYSVDLCARAGAGGEFLTAAASFAAGDVSAAQLRAVNPQSAAIAPMRMTRSGSHGGAASATEGASMKKSILQLLEALRQKNAARCAELSLNFATVAEADYPSFLDTVSAALTVAAPAATGTPTLTAESAQAILTEAQRLQSRNRIAAKLTESKLPEPARKLANTHLESALTAEANLSDAVIDAEIAQVRDAFAAFNVVGRVRPGTGVTLDSADKLELAMEAAMGVKESTNKGVPAFRGLREAYTHITGDYNLDRLRGGGCFTGHVLASEAVLTGDFPNILLNSMTKRLLQDWAELALDGLNTLYTKASISDYKLQDRVREGYFGELPIVTEGSTYNELTYPTDELISYQMVKHGGMLTISEETIRNDDLGAIARFPGRLARSGRFTLKRFITTFFLTNPNYTADGVAWFNAAHNNVQAVALSVTSLTVAQTSLRLQTEKNSGEPLGFGLQWLMVPAALEATADAINQTDTAGSNQFYHKFGVNNERIIVNEMLDATDNASWYYGTDQNNAPFLEMGFLDGIENPQIFLANQPTIGTQFTMDELQYKVKFPFSGAIIDYRGVGKSVV
ncbi:MAG: phage major capsid protein [Acidobacteriaceae bacterium]